MSDNELKTQHKRPIDSNSDNNDSTSGSSSASDDEDEIIGPTLDEASTNPPAKKKKQLMHESLYLENLPCAESYEKSYMHRDIVTHCLVTKTDFIITASVDGHVKFWKKIEIGIEFVKHFRSHLGPITKIASNIEGTLLCTASLDKSLKIFDIVNFDMINMIKLDYIPNLIEWIHNSNDPINKLAVCDLNSSKIYIYDGCSNEQKPIHLLDNQIHKEPIIIIKFNSVYSTIITIDKNLIIEYWDNTNYLFNNKLMKFETKLDTDLYEFFKKKILPIALDFSKDGKLFVTISKNHKIHLFNFLTGKLLRLYDESIQYYNDLQQIKQLLPNMEFGRRIATEKDLEKSEAINYLNILFDYSGNFILYSTLLGIKLINLITNKCMKIIGKNENLRILNIALYQGSIKKSKAAVTLEIEGSNNPTLESIRLDPTIVCTAYKKSRFYLFSRREPNELLTSTTIEGGLEQQQQDRDIFNEKPSKEDIYSATDNLIIKRLYETAIIHTIFGDIHIKLFLNDVPKSVENFCVHSKNGYYNNNIFHRVIKGFMIQTGDPTGNGTGGESIWGSEFEDEIRTNLKHDRPYTVSMANSGPHTNGSQFFITLTPTPWLDGKHTIFGRVVKGMEVVQNISNVKTNTKTDKPFDDIRIISISVK